MNFRRTITGVIIAVCCSVMLLPPLVGNAAYNSECRVNVSEMTTDEGVFENNRSIDFLTPALQSSRKMKHVEYSLSDGTRCTLDITNKKISVTVKAEGMKAAKVNMRGKDRKLKQSGNVASGSISISSLDDGNYGGTVMIINKKRSDENRNFDYFFVKSDDPHFYSLGSSYNQELLDKLESWYSEDKKSVITDNFGSNIDPSIAAKTDEIISGLSSDAQKASAIHSWIVDNIKYDDYNYDHDIDFAIADPLICFKNKAGICDGISSLYMEMCNHAGIPCLKVTGPVITDEPQTDDFFEGNMDPDSHAWNVICIDGKWSYCDPTWDVNHASKLEYYRISAYQMGLEHVGDCIYMPHAYNESGSYEEYSHRWDNGNITRPASSTECAEVVYTCTKCGVKRTIHLPNTPKMTFDAAGGRVSHKTLVTEGVIANLPVPKKKDSIFVGWTVEKASWDTDVDTADYDYLAYEGMILKDDITLKAKWISKGASVDDLNNCTYRVTRVNGKKVEVSFDSYKGKSKELDVDDFQDLDSIANIKVTSIAANALKGNKKLRNISFESKGLTKIGENAFKGCSNLKEITLYSSKITSIGKNAFAGLPGGVSIYVNAKNFNKINNMINKAGLPTNAWVIPISVD